MATEITADGAAARKHSVLDSSFPVVLPHDESLFLPEADFQTFVKKLVDAARNPHLRELEDEIGAIDKTAAENSTGLKRRASVDADDNRPTKAPFVAGPDEDVAHFQTVDDLAAQNKSLTENTDVTHISSQDPLIDLFYDLGNRTASYKLEALLENAWKEDALVTVKIIFNARSIHIGKSNRVAAYKAFGWLAENHPLTLLTNLRWLVRPVVADEALLPDRKDDKKKDMGIETHAASGEGKAKDEDEDFEMIEADETAPKDPAKAYDVRYGLSHGYWKDLLNLVVFAANDQLKFDGDPSSLLTQEQDKSKTAKKDRVWSKQEARVLRQKKNKERHERVIDKLRNDGFYRALHGTVARLFADQLKEDSALLKSEKEPDLTKLSLAAKWAPTFGEFHDKHTFILSSIAEILFPTPAEVCPDASNRELYLRHAREAFRKNYASPLRKALSVVERDITTENFADIEYERVPSLAMKRYTPLFMRKDSEHFSDYANQAVKGSAKIPGATPETKAKKIDPLALLNKAVSHKAYDMLEVVD
ncbi:hypothetical protein BU26DRAFT_514784 [Trematosphaeria pertusa]|uniref:DUF2828 domain-containing protein n=1 Tax=Trematosphaeria pertusa TaxID=390896 RepID=A0A6A6J0L7_9PLEO|nr:uncharacterized protein BU26DRAFT_514784 [Trematosphaeria pertusa]KAF2254953.1 hypothetical protein BU26DRAFT_514784 [Trematosphaeria pertusa]